MKNDRHLNHPAHKTTCQNRPISWPFSSSFSNGKEKDYESGFHYYGARYYWGELLTGWLSIDPMSDKYPSISPYAYCAWNPIKLMDPDGRDWVLVTGDKVRWYGGEKGDRSNLMHTYNSASGYMDEHKDFRQAKYQHKKNCGPTPAGEYRINLVPDPNRVANANYDDGQLIRNKDGGIELIPESFKGRYFEYTYESWGKRRALLQPVNVTGAGSNERDNNSYYLHDSEKCYTHGCTEVESEFFDQLIEYRDAGNKKISVVVEYPSDNHKTYSNACE